MKSWSKSLIKLASYEVETLQKRLGEIVGRRLACQARIEHLMVQAQVETIAARGDTVATMNLPVFLKGVQVRKASIEAEIEQILIEEEGARDALARAFETQKKYEQVAENMRLEDLKIEGQRETAALDELGLRRSAHPHS
jgi:flagellar FliJ protein